MGRFRYRTFGLTIESVFPLPGAARASGLEQADLLVHRAAIGDNLARMRGDAQPVERWLLSLGAGPFEIERDERGGFLFSYPGQGTYFLAPDHGHLTCAPAHPGLGPWLRELMDTVLHCISLIHGFQALHASAIELPHGVVGFIALSGTGKSTLAAELIRRGHPLFCDDVLVLDRRDPLTAHPGPGLMSLSSSGPAAGGADELGPIVARFGEEMWIELANASAGPRPLAALFFLDRGAEAVGVSRQAHAPESLVANALGLGRGLQAGLDQLATYVHVASSVPVYLLSADPAARPDELADLVVHTATEASAERLNRSRLAA